MLKSKAKRSVNKSARPSKAGRNAQPSPATGAGVHQSSAQTAPAASAEAASGDAGSFKTKSGVDLTEKFKELLLLAKEQGHLTYDDINDALPESIVTPDD